MPWGHGRQERCLTGFSGAEVRADLLRQQHSRQFPCNPPGDITADSRSHGDPGTPSAPPPVDMSGVTVNYWRTRMMRRRRPDFPFTGQARPLRASVGLPWRSIASAYPFE